MALFGSLAFAGDDWQDGFAKALDQNNLAGAMTLAYNSQASPHAVYEALDAFGVDQKEMGQSLVIAQEDPCNDSLYDYWCNVCCPASQSHPISKTCRAIKKDCPSFSCSCN